MLFRYGRLKKKKKRRKSPEGEKDEYNTVEWHEVDEEMNYSKLAYL